MHQRCFHSPLGPLTIVESAGAVVSLDWGIPDAESSTPLLDEAISQLEAYFHGLRRRFDLPLAPIGTPFQQRVWGALSEIPFGETLCYGDVAKTLATAARAIGTACARNPIPIIIPCHRVVSAAGDMGGYSGFNGVATKQHLLNLEKTFR